MRVPNDKKLTQRVPDLDLVLGGHDHTSENYNINDTLLLKSGTDFREFSIIDVTLDCTQEMMDAAPQESVVNYTKNIIVSFERVQITKQFEQQQSLQLIIDDYSMILDQNLSKVAGF